MLSKHEKQQLKYLVSDPKWKVVERLADLLIEKIRENSPVRDSEWETLRTTLEQEGKIRGIKEFIQEIYREVQNA